MSTLSTGNSHVSAKIISSSKLRPRACPRPACAVPAPPRADPCCDDKCLIEVARRECNKEGSHDNTIEEGPRVNGNDGLLSGGGDKSLPCVDHYQQTKDKFGSYLENLGCICKVLLSMGIESCCTIPSHASYGSLASRSSSKSSHKTTAAATSKPAATTMQSSGDCVSKGCCDTQKACEVIAKPEASSLPSNECGKGCCTGDSTSKRSIHTENHSRSEAYLDPVPSQTSTDIGSRTEKSLQGMGGCAKKGCCDDEAGPPNTSDKAIVTNAAVDSCSDKDCCSSATSDYVGTHSHIQGHHHEKADHKHDHHEHRAHAHNNVFSRFFPKFSTTTSGACCGHGHTTKASASTTIVHHKSTTATGSIDIELGNQAVAEHLLVQVQGMDCTGCEKKLNRALSGLNELSNIKTSLMLATAEFDLTPTATVNLDNILQLMDKMTGFTCTKITRAGAELELVIDGDLEVFVNGVWPDGVNEITAIGKKTIQVSYQPREIGARDLLKHPFFRGQAQLAPLSAPAIITTGRAQVWHTLWLTILSVGLTVPVLILTWAPIKSQPIRYGGASLALATIVQFAIGGPFYKQTFNTLIFSRMIDMDLLIVLSSTTAYVYSIVAFAYLAIGKPLATEQFFETSTLLLTLIMVGRLVSAFARQKAVESITIESLQTETAILVDRTSQQDSEIDARLLQYGDEFKVLPEMSVVTDGVVVVGESDVDESMVTGESRLIPKAVGMSVIAGSVNHSGVLTAQVTRLPFENTIKNIGDLVDQAKSSKPKVQELADRVASYFVPVILAITLIVFVVWIAVGKVHQHEESSQAAINAMTFAISVLIVSCPCAIGLAVPMVVVIAGGVAARHGLVFKTAETIDVGRKVSHVVFDKTGTLTQGTLSVASESYPIADQKSLILGLTQNSQHPVSKAIAAHLSGISASTALSNLTSVPGKGIEATSGAHTIRAGNPNWLQVETHPVVLNALSQGHTLFCVTLDNNLAAVYGLKDTLRPDALSTITELQRRKIAISILSGDNEPAVLAVAAQLNIPASNVRASQSPEQKQAYIKELMAEEQHDHSSCGDDPHAAHGHSHAHSHAHGASHKHTPAPTILFIGDGTNDAPSLAAATIGLHVSSGGTDVASAAADAVLMRPALSGILTLIDLSSAFHRRVLFNFTWSAIYNLAAVLLAAGVGGGRFRIPPAYAGLGEVVSVVPVVGAAVLLRWWKAKY